MRPRACQQPGLSLWRRGSGSGRSHGPGLSPAAAATEIPRGAVRRRGLHAQATCLPVTAPGPHSCKRNPCAASSHRLQSEVRTPAGGAAAAAQQQPLPEGGLRRPARASDGVGAGCGCLIGQLRRAPAGELPLQQGGRVPAQSRCALPPPKRSCGPLDPGRRPGRLVRVWRQVVLSSGTPRRCRARPSIRSSRLAPLPGPRTDLSETTQHTPQDASSAASVPIGVCVAVSLPRGTSVCAGGIPPRRLQAHLPSLPSRPLQAMRLFLLLACLALVEASG